jgi:quinolinate synthase
MTGKQAAVWPDQRNMIEVEMEGRIAGLRVKLGDDLLILGHHYQSDAVIGQADLTGDSLKLAQQASRLTNSRFIVFCGVKFMAETAKILAAPGQRVHLPALEAGCPMADMVELDQLEDCWRQSIALWGGSHDGSGLVPITYVNSSVEVKAFCGRHGGAVCTSANAQKIMAWALDKGRRALFLPDQHLGRNTAFALGLASDEICLWDRKQGKLLGSGPRSKVVLWDGYCPVHVCFKVAQIEETRAAHPDAYIIVHPECPWEVVQAADASGSTEQIISAVAAAPAGSTLAVGTEINLVRRLALRHQDKKVVPLSSGQTACPDMARTNPAVLLSCLEGLPQNRCVVKVPDHIAFGARLALERMLLLT